MATIEQVLARAAAPLGTGGGLEAQLDRLSGQFQQLQSVNQAALESTRGNTQAVQGSTPVARETSTGRSVGGTILSALGTGLGLSPLISGVLKLFGGSGGGITAPPPLAKFGLPASRSVSAGISDAVPAAAFAVDYAQGAMPRAVTNPVAGPQVTVQVQAMDSRSCRAHSNYNALAGRQAMRESSVHNDVVREA